MGKATSFVDPEGDGDVMPKLVDMLTKVKELLLPFVRSIVLKSFLAYVLKPRIIDRH